MHALPVEPGALPVETEMTGFPPAGRMARGNAGLLGRGRRSYPGRRDPTAGEPIGLRKDGVVADRRRAHLHTGGLKYCAQLAETCKGIKSNIAGVSQVKARSLVL